jgi:hypothetical protein
MKKDDKNIIGEKLSPILEELEKAIWSFEVYNLGKLNYTEDGFRASIKIFMSTLMDKIWELQEKEGMDIENRGKMVEKAGEDLRKLIKIYTDIDTHELYKKVTDC